MKKKYNNFFKKSILVFFLGFCLLGICFAQEQEIEQEQENFWKGMVRFNPADLFINLHNYLPGLYITWIPYYIFPTLGIPVELDLHFGWGILPGVEISLLTGLEYVLIRNTEKDKNGLFLDLKAGVSFIFNEGSKTCFVVKSNIGYQFVTKRGFVATPAVGIVINWQYSFGLNLMLDLGFAYR